ncbi:MAG TPA: hypothetical protein DCM87_03130 [Planctomycetes bacterium]|nr:hypothetical protein [Planctomycetota bacterium]
MTAVLCCTCLWLLGAGVDEEIRLYDEVRLKNGQVLTGLIKDDTDPVEVKMALLRGDGTVRDLVGIPRSTVKEIVPRRTPAQIYRDQVKKRDLMNAAQLFELAAWCAAEQAGLYGEAAVLAHRALRLAPAMREVYPLLATLNARKEIAALTAEEADREVELAMRAREHGVFLAGAWLRAARVLLEQSKDAWSVVTDEAVRLLADVRAKGTAEEAAAATSALSSLYLAWEKLDDLLALKTPGGADVATPETVAAKLLLRGSEKDLADAEALIASLPDGGSRKLAEASLAWSRGDMARTQTLLLEAVELTKSPEAARALAIVLALGGKTKTAEELAKIVAPQGADGALLSYVLGAREALDAFMSTHGALPAARLLAAEEMYRRGDAEGAAAAAAEMLAGDGMPSSARALAWPLVAKARARTGALDEAVARLLCARAALPGEGRVALALAAVAAFRNDLYEGRTYLEEARDKQVPAGEAALVEAYLAYREGNLAAASRAAAALSADVSLPAACRAYATHLQRAAWEATRLQSWEDTFERPDATEVLNSWYEDEKYGIRIALAGNQVRFAGAQEGAADATTFLFVYTEYGRLFRASFRMRPQRDDMAFGVQIVEGAKVARIEAQPGGAWAYVVPGARSDRSEALPLAWQRGAWHRVTIEFPAKGRPVIEVEGRRAELPQTVLFAKNANVKLGVFVRGGRQGAEVELELDAAKLWRLSDEEVRKGKRSG